MRNLVLRPNPDRVWFTAEGYEMHPGQTVYRRKLDWGLQSGSAVKDAFGCYTAVVGYSLPVMIRVARHDYRCEDCGQQIYKGEDHGSDYYTHICLNCVTPKQPATEFREAVQ